MSFLRSFVKRLLPSLLALHLGVVAAPSHAGPVDAAEDVLVSGDLTAALILLKDRLQQAPNDPDARLLLAQVYLRLGSPRAAEQELQRVQALTEGARPEFEVLMARALLEQGQAGRALEWAADDAALPAAERAKRLALRGDAYLGMDDPQAAAEAYGQALTLVSDYSAAMLGVAKVAARQRLGARVDEALAAALAANPDDAETRVLAGDQSFITGDFAQAEAAYSKALYLAPDKPWLVQYKRALARIETGAHDRAEADLTAAARENPSFSGLDFGRGLLAFRKAHYDAAFQSLERYLTVNPEDAQAMYLVGAALYSLGRYAQADEYLARLVERGAPGSVEAGVLLASARLLQGDAPGAEKAVAGYVEGKDVDPRALRLYARALQMQGRTDQAEEALMRAKQAAGGNNEARLALALHYLDAGKPESARSELLAILRGDPTLRAAHTLLVRSYVDEGNAAAATEAAGEFVEIAPQEPSAHFALGVARRLAGDRDGARVAFEASARLAADPSDAEIALAALAREGGDAAVARAIYARILKRDPTQSKAVIALAELDLQGGDADVARERLRIAAAAAPQDPVLVAALARLLLGSGDIDAALALFQGLPAAVGDQPALLLLRAQAERAVGQPMHAVATLQKLANVLPGSAESGYLLASALAATDNKTGMQEQLLDAFTQDPEHPLAVDTIVTVMQALPSAEDQARLLQRLGSGRRQPTLQFADGLIKQQNGDVAGALAVFTDLTTQYPDERRYLDALLAGPVRAGQPAAAMNAARSWLVRHPDDLVIRRQLAQLLGETGKGAESVAAYREILKTAPDDVASLNNLAMLLLDTDPGAAYNYAAKAEKLAPSSPAVADTFGLAALRLGKLEQAESALKRAREALPADPAIADHYARVLSALAQARGETTSNVPAE